MPRSLAEVTPAVRYAWSAVRVSGGTRGTRRQILSSEFGDVPDRYTDAKSRRNYAGTSPVTRASGTRRIVLARHARKKRLADAIYLWAFSAISASPGARAFYDYRRAAGDTHHQALRAVGNHLVGFLHGCLASHTLYNERKAWAHRRSPEIKAAA
jgi:hypothetical protein